MSQLDRVTMAVRRLHSLLADPHPGLSTWGDALHRAKAECVNAIADHEPKKCAVPEAARTAHLSALVDRYADALRHVLWIKDCGVDGTDEHGVFRNFPETERDAMYRIAKEAIEGGDKSTPQQQSGPKET